MPAEKGKVRFPGRSVTGCTKHIPEQAPEKTVVGQHKMDSIGLGVFFGGLFISFCFDLDFFIFLFYFIFGFVLRKRRKLDG